ncbi:RHO protein GDP dissociation inhibitor [Seiridium cupressi]
MAKRLSQRLSTLLIPASLPTEQEDKHTLEEEDGVEECMNYASCGRTGVYSVSIEANTPPSRRSSLVWREVTVVTSPATDPVSHPYRKGDIALHISHVSPLRTTNMNAPADANDESLQRYKESLGLGGGKDLSDPNDRRVCIIKKLSMESPGRPAVTIDLAAPGSETTLKDKPFKIKEGSKFTMVAEFNVQHEILSGLQYVQIVKRKGIKVSKDSEMLGSYAPNTDKQPVYTKRFQEEEAPSGMLARGHYNAVSTFVDDDKKNHLQFEWSFDIAKDWDLRH